MPHPIVMPSMGMYTEEGVLTAWLRPAEAHVQAGEAVAEITTEKTTFEIPALATGILHPVAEVGTRLTVQGLMGYILAEGEKPPVGAAVETTLSSRNTETSEHISEPSVSRPSGPLRASPVARRLAEKHSIDLNQVTGSGPGGRIVEADVLAAVSNRDQKAADSTSDSRRIRNRLPLIGHRRTIADRLTHSLRNAASTTLTREADAEVLVAARGSLAAKMGTAPSYDALFIKLLAAALREHMELNATVTDDSIVVFDDVNVGFAVASLGSLVVPVVQNADIVSLTDISRAVGDLESRAAAGRLRPADVMGGTATITNLGAHGIDAFTPILNSQESVVLGIGRITPRPVTRDGTLAIGRTCVLSLTFDHRVADGVPAAQLLASIVMRMNDRDFLEALA